LFSGWSPHRGLRRRCESALSTLELPARGMDVELLRQRLEARRGRRITLTPLAGSRAAHGLWLSTDTADYVHYEGNTTPWHQQNTICHEFSHMLLGHDADAATATAEETLLLPDIAGDTVRFVLHRSAYDSRQEQEAEYFAMLIMQRIEHASALPRVTADAEGAAAVRLLQALGDEN
jgi:Zn-dependent peptidase ImmA (M78 family)